MQQKPNSQKGREKRHSTRYRGISYRDKANGSRTYYVTWSGGYLKAGKTEEEALAKQAELRGKRARGEKVILPSKKTVRELTEEWWSCPNAKLRPHYRNENEVRRILDKEILPAWGDLRIGAIDVDDIFALDAEWEARGLSESGRANYFKPARRVFDYAVFKKARAVSPFSQAPRGSLPSCNTTREHHEWKTEEIERFYAVAHERDERPEARRAYGDQIELMCRTGLRIGEASGLRFSDIEGNVLHVRRQWDGTVLEYLKTKASQRRIPLTDEMVARLNFRQSFYGLLDDDFIFAEEVGGNPPSHSNFRRRGWNEVVKTTGLKLEEGVKVTPHDSRHACVSQLDDLGLESRQGATLLGHSSAGITERIYVHAFDRDEQEEQIRKMMRAAQNGGQS